MSTAMETQTDRAETEQRPEIDTELVDSIFNAAVEDIKERHHVPSSTYRVQFNREFTFLDAREQAAYLARLGIGDLYASPFFKARPESMHGYDIVNHNELTRISVPRKITTAYWPNCASAAWARCSISCPTTWASAN